MGAGIGISWWMSALSSLPPLSASVGADPGPTTATEAFKFTFRDKKGKLKWRQVCRPDVVESIVSKGDVGRLQEVLEEVAFASVSPDDLQTVADEQILALINLLQLGLEFTLSMYSQSYHITEQLMGRVAELTATKKKLKHRLIAVASEGGSVHHPRGIPCGDCEKRFEDGHFLTEHVKRRHAPTNTTVGEAEKENAMMPTQHQAVGEELLRRYLAELSTKVDQLVAQREAAYPREAQMPAAPVLSESLVERLKTESRLQTASLREDIEGCIKEMVSEKMQRSLGELADEIDRKLGTLDEKQKTATQRHEEWIASNLQRAVSRAVSLVPIPTSGEGPPATYAGELEDDYDDGEGDSKRGINEAIASSDEVDASQEAGYLENEIAELRRRREEEGLARRMSIERRENIIAEMHDMFKSVVTDSVMGKMLLENPTPKLTVEAACQPSPEGSMVVPGVTEVQLARVGETTVQNGRGEVGESLLVVEEEEVDEGEERVVETTMRGTSGGSPYSSLLVDTPLMVGGDETRESERGSLRESPEVSVEDSEGGGSITSTRVQSAVTALRPTSELRSFVESLPTSQRAGLLIQGAMEGIVRRSTGVGVPPQHGIMTSPRVAVVEELLTASLTSLFLGRSTEGHQEGGEEMRVDAAHSVGEEGEMVREVEAEVVNSNLEEGQDSVIEVMPMSPPRSDEESEVLPIHHVVAERSLPSRRVEAVEVNNSVESLPGLYRRVSRSEAVEVSLESVHLGGEAVSSRQWVGTPEDLSMNEEDEASSGVSV